MISSVPYAVYERSSGRVVRWGTCVPDQIELQRAGDPALRVVQHMIDDTVDLGAHFYVVDGKLVERPLNQIVVENPVIHPGTGTATLRNIPPNSAIRINGQHLILVNDGVLNLRSPVPTTFRVEVHCFPETELSTEIVVR